jgi:hypothetical protein
MAGFAGEDLIAAASSAIARPPFVAASNRVYLFVE